MERHLELNISDTYLKWWAVIFNSNWMWSTGQKATKVYKSDLQNQIAHAHPYLIILRSVSVLCD